MQLLSSKKPKTQTNQYVDQNPVEAIRNVGSGATQSFASDFWEQMFGETNPPAGGEKKQTTSGELAEGQELDLESHSVEPGINYRREILHGDDRIVASESHAQKQRIEMIIVELKRLASSSKELEIQFKDVVVEQRITKPGKYHQGFFEWMLIIVRSARMRVEDAGAWLSAMHGKKNKKHSQNYWQMFKKHGTTFGLSNERVVATQTG